MENKMKRTPRYSYCSTTSASLTLPDADSCQVALPQKAETPAAVEYKAGKPRDDFDAYNAATARLIQAAANELAACAYPTRGPVLPDNHELRFCLPGRRVALYRNLRTGEDIVLRRNNNANTFCKSGLDGWEAWAPSDA
jgi:hypothetical protein